jgi:hypothetical protein
MPPVSDLSTPLYRQQTVLNLDAARNEPHQSPLPIVQILNDWISNNNRIPAYNPPE